MADGYDMCVDYVILCGVEDKLQKIEYDLNNSADQMVKAIEESQNFLEGYQFEEVKKITASCVEITRKTGTNITHAMEYLGKLKTALEEYGRCGYNREA